MTLSVLPWKLPWSAITFNMIPWVQALCRLYWNFLLPDPWGLWTLTYIQNIISLVFLVDSLRSVLTYGRWHRCHGKPHFPLNIQWRQWFLACDHLISCFLLLTLTLLSRQARWIEVSLPWVLGVTEFQSWIVFLNQCIYLISSPKQNAISPGKWRTLFP